MCASRRSPPTCFSEIILGIPVFTSNKYIRPSQSCLYGSGATTEPLVSTENPARFCGIGSGRMKNTKRFWRIGSDEHCSALRPNFTVRPGTWVTGKTGHIGYTLCLFPTAREAAFCASSVVSRGATTPDSGRMRISVSTRIDVRSRRWAARHAPYSSCEPIA